MGRTRIAMMSRSFVLLSVLAATASAMSLTGKNYDSAVAGKTVFIEFQAPW